jgi:hypothetical protein
VYKQLLLRCASGDRSNVRHFAKNKSDDFSAPRRAAPRRAAPRRAAPFCAP